MANPIWLEHDLVLTIHNRQLAEHGGLSGVRNIGLLEQALHKPLQSWSYAEPQPDLYELAADYAFGIARSHSFIDGNKRTAWVACRLFLQINGMNIHASAQGKYDIMIDVASGQITRDKFAEWLRAHSAMFN